MSAPTTTDSVHVALEADGTAHISGEGPSVDRQFADVTAARQGVIAELTSQAQVSGAPVDVDISDPDGHWTLRVAPDGSVTANDQPTTKPVTTQESEAPAAQSEIANVASEPARLASAEPKTDPDPVETAPRRGNESFLTVNRVEEPASQGWRGLLNHIGLHLAPSTHERSERADVQAVSQHWPGPRVIVVANQKGGATKTPTTILLAACFARFGGAGVAAWDTNQLQGTLGWRTEQGPHEATAQDLLPQAERLLGTEAQSADLAHYVHHQTGDRFDVLRSQPLMLDAGKRYTPAQVDSVRRVLAKYYRMIVCDTSNDPSDPAWLEIMSHADQLVVATTSRDDHAEAGRLLLQDLESRGGHDAELAAGAVTVVSQADQRAPKSEVDRIMAGYADLTRATVHIPWDPAMVSGWLRWGALARPTRRAWLAAGAAVAGGL